MTVGLGACPTVLGASHIITHPYALIVDSQLHLRFSILGHVCPTVTPSTVLGAADATTNQGLTLCYDCWFGRLPHSARSLSDIITHPDALIVYSPLHFKLSVLGHAWGFVDRGRKHKLLELTGSDLDVGATQTVATVAAGITACHTGPATHSTTQHSTAQRKTGRVVNCADAMQTRAEHILVKTTRRQGVWGFADFGISQI